MVALKTLPGLYQCPPPDRQSLSRQPDFYGNTIHNSETAVQYAGHFALRLANLGLSASSQTDARPGVCWRSLVMRFDSTEGRRITWRRLGLAVPRGCGAAVTTKASNTNATSC